MTAEELAAYALAKPGAWADSPWNEDHHVAKVGGSPADGANGKIFAFLAESTVGVKAGRTREEADEWLHRYPEDATVMAYIGRAGWNTLVIGGAIPGDELRDAIDESYRMVVEKLPKRQRPIGWDA